MIKPFEIPCVILCGGRSSRMGEDKALLPFSSSKTLTQYQYHRLKPFFKNLYISSKINKFDFLENQESLLLDKNEIYSPLVALATIFEELKEKQIFIITVDTPLVSIKSIDKIIKNSKEFDITVAKTLRTHNLCGVFSSNIGETIKNMLEEDIHKIGYLLKQSNTNVVPLSDDKEFLNLNNKSEYKKAIEYISKLNN